MRHLLVTITALVSVAAIAPATLAYEDGFYFSFGVGSAHGSGDRGVPLIVPSKCAAPSPYLWFEDNGCIHMPSAGVTTLEQEVFLQARLDEVVRADPGAMLGLQLRLGYNILGHASVETALSVAGALPLTGSFHVGGQVRWHPVELFIPHQDRDWDVSTFVGGGFSMAGYSPQFDAEVHGGEKTSRTEDVFDRKGWKGVHVAFGFGMDYQLSELASVGFDLKFIRPLYSRWIANFEENYGAAPESTPSAWIVTPTVQVTLHFWSPED